MARQVITLPFDFVTLKCQGYRSSAR
jgi:hypothetical protein